DPVAPGGCPTRAPVPALHWRLRVGGADAAAVAAALSARHPVPWLTVEPAAADWHGRLASARAAITLAGYNTVADLAALDVPALLVPDETGGEREQAIRARLFARWPGIETAALDTLDAAALAAAAHRLAAGPRRAPLPLALDGAAESARRLMGLVRNSAA
ncbi:MAG: glycosyltransferase, partial [Pseudomonadota bacterium]